MENREIKLGNEKLEREVFEGLTEKEYFRNKKWQETKGDIIAYSVCFLGFMGFMLLAIILELLN